MFLRKRVQGKPRIHHQPPPFKAPGKSVTKNNVNTATVYFVVYVVRSPRFHASGATRKRLVARTHHSPPRSTETRRIPTLDMPTFVTQDLAYVTPGHSTVAEPIWHKMHFWHPIPGFSPVGKRSNYRTHLCPHGSNTSIERLNRIWNVKHLSKIRLK